MEFEEIKEGMEIYFFSLSRSFGRVWEIDRSRIKIIKINEKSIRINRLDDNNGKGFLWTMKKPKFIEYIKNCSLTKKDAYSTTLPHFKRWSEEATTNLKGYTSLHKDYKWYMYSKHILTYFYQLVKEGFTKEKYLNIKKKYKKEEKAFAMEAFK